MSDAGYIDVDCGLSVYDIPSVKSVLDRHACCSMQCEEDDCVGLPRDDRCSVVTLSTIKATHNATCRFTVNTVRSGRIAK